jgi:hypothetical protein
MKWLMNLSRRSRTIIIDKYGGCIVSSFIVSGGRPNIVILSSYLFSRPARIPGYQETKKLPYHQETRKNRILPDFSRNIDLY